VGARDGGWGGNVIMVLSPREPPQHLDRGVIMRRSHAMRLCGFGALLLWCAALFAPIDGVHSDALFSGSGGSPRDPLSGWMLALIGWLGPLYLAPG
jgi:hypothetical protein